MPYISCFVDDRTLHVLERISQVQGLSVEQIAANAIEGEAISQLPGGRRDMHWGGHRAVARLDLGDTAIAMVERPSGDITFEPFPSFNNFS